MRWGIMRTEQVELTVLCLIHKDDSYLLQDRIKKDWKGFTLPGGHIEPGESIVDAVVREMKEETGLTVEGFSYRGLVTFIQEGGIIEYMHLYTVDRFSGEIIECDEGTLKWIDKEEVFQLNLWEGDKIFLKLLLEDKGYFSLKLRYREENLIEAREYIQGVSWEK